MKANDKNIASKRAASDRKILTQMARSPNKINPISTRWIVAKRNLFIINLLVYDYTIKQP